MKIQFLNTDCTEAVVTRGWFRPMRAHVVFKPTDGWWYFALTERRLDHSADSKLCRRMNAEKFAQREREYAGKEWIPVDRFPRARLVERKS